VIGEVTLELAVVVRDEERGPLAERHGGRYTVTRELALNDDLAQGHRGAAEFVDASARYVDELAERIDDEAGAAMLRTIARGLRRDG
jgi:hypothetical protein